MKIIAINGSPRGCRGNTYRMLVAMREGVLKTSAEMEIINLSEIVMHMCIGCFRCWDKAEPNEIKCILKDDVESVFREMLDCNLWIFASPVYYDNVSAYMKIFMERMVMFHNPEIKSYGNIYAHDIAFNIPPVVMLASCDLPGHNNFDIISLLMKKIALNLNTELIEEIYQSEARILTWPLDSLQILASCRRKLWIKAGYELALQGKLSDRLKIRLNSLLIPIDDYLESAKELAEETKRKAVLNEGDGYGGY